MMPKTNYFAAESSIIDRLKDRVRNIKAFYTPFSTNDVLQLSEFGSAIHVIYAGDTITGNDGNNGARNIVSQRWLVVLAVRTARAQLQDTAEARETAGEIIPEILAALQGWQPDGMQRELSRVTAPPAAYESGFAYFPFMFEGRIIN